MPGMKRILSFIISAMLLTSAFCAPASAAAEPISYKTAKVTAHLYSEDETETFTCLFRSDLPAVPYIGASDYLNQLYTVEFTTAKNSDGTFTVSDKYGDMVVDADKDTIHFDSYEDFAFNDPRPTLEDETCDYIEFDSSLHYVGDAKGLDLDLKKYGIDLTSWGDEVYFPLSTINDIFACVYHAALYIDGELWFADVMEDELYYDDSSLYKTTKRDKTLIEYTYNEICFVMDTFYGRPPRSQLSDSIADKGFDRTLEEYDRYTKRAKELLLSDDLIDYCYGMMFLDKYLDDGGHTTFSYGMQMGMDSYPDSAFTEAVTDSMYDLVDDRNSVIMEYYQGALIDQNQEEGLAKYREQEYAKLTEVRTWDDAAFYRSGETGVFVFDEFRDAVVEPFKWSLDYARDNGLENFVIDLSVNGGGSTAVSTYMMSVMRGYDLSEYYDTMTGNRFYTDDTIDRNLDGEFDEKDDDVRYDLRFAVLTSRFSFSCANMTACVAKDNDIAVIGETSGGGTCAVAVHYDPAGYMYAISDDTMMVHPDGSDVDGGAEPDCRLPGQDASYVGFYDIESIERGVEAFYTGKTIPEPTAAPQEEPTAVADPVEDETSVYVWTASIAVSLIAAAIFAIILIGGSKKRKRV